MTKEACEGEFDHLMAFWLLFEMHSRPSISVFLFEIIIHIFKGGYCCAPGDDYGDCSEMIRYGMSLIDPLIDTNEFKCIHYRHPVSYFVMLHNLCIYRLTHF